MSPSNTTTPGTNDLDAGDDSVAPRIVTFYLPQFHPIPLNDEHWGPGFTEWHNVVTARPRFPGHYQPHLPADLGFYDLRLPETRMRQAELAADHGIHGFCWYHYWFHGQRLLERPFDEVLRSGEPRFPFMLCWANEPWTRRWDGSDAHVLVKQHYSAEDDLAHIRALAEALCDPRYIRVDGKPILAVYRVAHLDEPARMVDTWRSEAQRLGVGDLYLAAVQAWDARDPTVHGFDAAIHFQPDARLLGPQPLPLRALTKFARAFGRRDGLISGGRIARYEGLIARALDENEPSYLRFPGVTPGWDNTARRKGLGARIILGSSPERYEHWLEAEITRFEAPTPTHNLVFVNAWNEWAEGCHLEPDQRWGHAYLEATRRASRAARISVVRRTS